MVKKLIPVLLIVLAAVGGLFGGDMLRAKPDPTSADPEADPGAHGAEAATEGHGEEAPSHEPPEAASHGKEEAGAKPSEGGGHGGAEEKATGSAYFRFPSQFFVPVMHGDRLDGLMVLTLTVEMPAEHQEAIFRQEFRLRDAFLRTLLIHANTGGFDGNYTIEPRMRRLREALLKTAQEQSEGLITDVLIEDIARQDAV